LSVPLLPVMSSLAGVPLHVWGGPGSHRITLAALWATAAPAIATTSAATAAPTKSTVNLLVMPNSSSSLFLDARDT
jgi:hypothetical protein